MPLQDTKSDSVVDAGRAKRRSTVTVEPASRTPPNVKSIAAIRTESDRLSILEFAEIFGFTPAELISAIERNRLAVKKPFYSIQDLAARWRCSRGTVYNVLRDSESKLLDLSDGKKGKRLIPAAVVEHIEQARMKPLPESFSDKAA